MQRTDIEAHTRFTCTSCGPCEVRQADFGDRGLSMLFMIVPQTSRAALPAFSARVGLQAAIS